MPVERAPGDPGLPLRVRVGAWWRLLHPFPSFLVSGLVVALVPLADRGTAVSTYVQLGLAMLCYQFAIGITNDLVDAPADAIAKPHKPLAARRVSRGAAAIAAVIFGTGGFLISSPLPAVAWAIGVVGLACGLAYDLRLKRTAWSWLPLSLALPLVPAWVWLATGSWDSFLLWVFPVGILLGLSLYLANQHPDLAGDRITGVRGLAQRIGPRSRPVAVSLFVATALLAVVVLATRSPVLAAATVGILSLSIALVPRATLWFGRDGLFGLLAVASAGIAVAFLAAA